MSAQLNCSAFATRDNFDAYVISLLNNTHHNLTLLSQCKSQICTALWGQGNADISGIGMLVGYLLEQVLGLLLVTACLIASHRGMISSKSVSERALGSFNDCATFFAFSVQIAALVVLMKEDFGISTSSMGDATVRITQAVSVLVLLPLLYVLMPSIYRPSSAESDTQTAEKGEQADDPVPQSSRRFLLLVLCWLLAFYPFYSKMNAQFGPSRICHTCAITPPEFAIVEEMCTERISTITAAEDALMTALEMLAYIPLSLLIVGRVMWLGLEKHHHDSKLYARLLAWGRNYVTRKLRFRLRIGCLMSIPLLACGLLWTILRTRRFQQQMSKMTSSGDSDAQWTFGQVVSVTVFAPVIVECWSAFQDAREQGEGSEASVRSDERASPERMVAEAKRGSV
ncbi:hypothetical protein LTR85_004023 [Meristemomyces frigidus]|nr:hypothetical protein LTR85_004023 [Meristemomyces frigidus]